MKRGAAERQAINAPVQSFANELNLMSLIEVCDDYSNDYMIPVGTVHDSILIEIRNDKVEEVVNGILKIMTCPKLLKDFGINLKVPVLADASIGPWGKGVNLKRWLKSSQ